MKVWSWHERSEKYGCFKLIEYKKDGIEEVIEIIPIMFLEKPTKC